MHVQGITAHLKITKFNLRHSTTDHMDNQPDNRLLRLADDITAVQARGLAGFQSESYHYP